MNAIHSSSGDHRGWNASCWKNVILYGSSAGRGLHVEVVELVRRAAGRRVDEPPAVARDIGPRAVERLFPQHRGGLVDAPGARRHAQHVAGPERDVPVRDQEQLVPVGQPGRRQVHVPRAEVQAVAAEVVVARDRDRLAAPAAIGDRPDVDVEVAARGGRHVGDAGPVGREDGVGVDLVVVGQRMRIPRGHVEDLELHRLPVVVRRVDDPAPVRRPVGGRVVGLSRRSAPPRRRSRGRRARWSRPSPRPPTGRPAPTRAPRASSSATAGSRS